MTTTAVLPSAVGGVLVASPSITFREQVRRSLPERRWPVEEVQGGADALAKLESGGWQMLFLDRRLPDLDAEEVVSIIRLRFPGTEVVVLDSDSDAVPLGPATRPPLSLEKIAGSAVDVAPLPGMVGQSAAMHSVYRRTRLVA